jgi:hypothetical protein
MNNKLNCCAHNISKPFVIRKGWENRGATALLDGNRKGIAKLRQRRFSWTQIHAILVRMGMNIDYNNLYQWQLRRFKQ